MRRLTLALIFILIAALICVTTWAADKTSTEKKAELKTTTMAKEKAEAVKPNDSLKKAKESFLKKDYKTASVDIKKAAAAIKLQTNKASTNTKEGLTASVNELDKLAADMGKGAVTSVKAINDAFARANHAIARNHYVKATEYSAKKNTEATGSELKSASEALENGLTWTGMKIEKATAVAIQTSRTIAGKMMGGTAVTGEETNKSMNNLSVELDKLGKLVMPAKGK